MQQLCSRSEDVVAAKLLLPKDPSPFVCFPALESATKLAPAFNRPKQTGPPSGALTPALARGLRAAVHQETMSTPPAACLSLIRIGRSEAACRSVPLLHTKPAPSHTTRTCPMKPPAFPISANRPEPRISSTSPVREVNLPQRLIQVRVPGATSKSRHAPESESSIFAGASICVICLEETRTPTPSPPQLNPGQGTLQAAAKETAVVAAAARAEKLLRGEWIRRRHCSLTHRRSCGIPKTCLLLQSLRRSRSSRSLAGL